MVGAQLKIAGSNWTAYLYFFNKKIFLMKEFFFNKRSLLLVLPLKPILENLF